MLLEVTFESESVSHSVMSDCVIPWTIAHQAPGTTGVGCHFLLQEIFLTQVLSPGLLHHRQVVYQLSHLGSIF